MTTDSDQHDSGANWKITGCLASAGAALGAANADATILYFNPEPDLIAIDTDVFAEGGLQQITIDFDYIPVSIPDKKSGGGGIDPGNLPPGFDPNNPPTDPAEIQDFIDSLG
ncbi:MAG: hypothetical protein KJO38_06080, partial [Gammaproteobacteria bacterium]|nr:hypothetical protein [Gammaproteobacteria bacterium]